MVFQTSLIDKLQTKPLKFNNELDISKDIWNQYHGIVNSAVNQLKPIERIKFNDAKKYAIDKIYGYRTKLEIILLKFIYPAKASFSSLEVLKGFNILLLCKIRPVNRSEVELRIGHLEN